MEALIASKIKAPRKKWTPLVPFAKLPKNATPAEKKAAKIARDALMATAKAAKEIEIAKVKDIKAAEKAAIKTEKEEYLKNEKRKDKIRKTKIRKAMVGRHIIEMTFRRLDMFRRIKNRMEGLIGQYAAFNHLAMLMLLGNLLEV